MNAAETALKTNKPMHTNTQTKCYTVELNASLGQPGCTNFIEKTPLDFKPKSWVRNKFRTKKTPFYTAKCLYLHQ